MPQLIVLVLVVALGFYCWNKVRAELVRLDEESDKSAKRISKKRSEDKKNKTQTLKQDPETGVYRLDDE